MSYLKSLLLYEDEPAYSSLLKLIIVIFPVGLIVASIYLWSSGESSGGLALLFEALFISLIFWIVFPHRYQVYEDHLRIVLGGPFAVKIGFERIKTVEVTRRMALTVNFATKLAMTYVIIVKKNGLSIAITPKSNESFVENANRALSEWARTREAESPTRAIP
ncbi:MAG: PH domain-containing protein [Chloroflexota bacterium]